MEKYKLLIGGLQRDLPLVYVGRKTRLASFSLLGDVELVEKLADLIAEKIRKINFDFLVGPEVKVVPLIHEVARKMKHKRFVVCRKSVKPNMISPVILKPLPFFPVHARQLVLDGEDAKLLKGKKVIIIDDVVSTGVTIRMMRELMKKVGAEVVRVVAVLKQGEQFDKMDDLIYLGELPIFKD